jgi:hypothetical protein
MLCNESPRRRRDLIDSNCRLDLQWRRKLPARMNSAHPISQDERGFRAPDVKT